MLGPEKHSLWKTRGAKSERQIGHDSTRAEEKRGLLSQQRARAVCERMIYSITGKQAQHGLRTTHKEDPRQVR